MQTQLIKCPQCDHEFKVDDVIAKNIETQLREHLEEEFKLKQDALEEDRKNIEADAQKKALEGLKEEKSRIEKAAEERVKESLGLRMEDLEVQLREKDEKLKESQKKELEALKKERAIKEREENLELEVEKRLQLQTEEISKKIKEDAEGEYAKQLRERDQQIKQMNKTIEELKRKGQQGSMQVQGDAQEENLKQNLILNYPNDQVMDVPTGKNGADLEQKVYTSFGQLCGSILWESKDQKSWSDDWIAKLKQDQANVGASVAIIATQVMPKGTGNIISREGVWIVEYKLAIVVASLMRNSIIEQHQMKQSMAGADEKMKYLHDYLTGPQFKNRVENIVLAFQGMKLELDREKNYIKTQWRKREKQIERVVDNTTGFYGDLQGIVGASISTVEALALPEAIPEEEMDEEEISTELTL